MTAAAFVVMAAAGAVVRHLAPQAGNRGFPWGTLAVNTVGPFLLGVLGGDSVVCSAPGSGER